MTATRGLALAAAMRVVDRVHGNTAVRRPDPAPSAGACLTQGDIFVVGIAHLANSCHAVHEHAASLTGGQLQQRVVAFLCDQLRAGPGRPNHLRALPWPQLHIVHCGTGGYVAQRKSITDQNVRLGPAHNLLTDLEADRLNDVSLFTVAIADQRDTGRTGWDRTQWWRPCRECRTYRA